MRPRSNIRRISYWNILESTLSVVVYVVCFQSLLAISADLAKRCTEDEEPLRPIQIILQANIVLYGKIIGKYPDKAVNGVYTAEMYVFCIIKGPPTKRLINITKAGYVPGACISTNFELQQKFVVVADYVNREYEPAETEMSPARLAEIATACRVNPQYPIGTNENGVAEDERCPTPAPSDECIDESHFTTTTTTIKTTTTADDYDDLNNEATGDPVYDDTSASATDFSRSSTSRTSSSTSSTYDSHQNRIVDQLLNTFLPHLFVCILLNGIILN